jgi:NAD(P)-dependent dehydrogenase (short-subunit alcohol dehydrogenase family)
MNLSDKVAIVTGGGGEIGKAIVKQLLKEGAQIVIADISKKEMSKIVQDLGQEGKLVAIPIDVSKKEEVENLTEQALKHFGTIDILVNAAGIQGPIGPFVETDIKEWVNTISINLTGTVLCCKMALPIMMKKKRGKIINFAGGGANYSRPNFSAYGVSKTAVVRLTEVLADELKDFNIQVNSLSPGIIKSKMIDEILKTGPKKVGKEYDQLKSKLKEEFDSPELVAQLVCYLASEESIWITGKVISAVWDPWKEWKDKGQTQIDNDLYTLRRIDGRNFIKVNR